MPNSPETFITVPQEDFNRLYPKPIKSSIEPPINTGTQLYLPRPDPEDCRCDFHGINSKKARYKQLADKERRLRNELIKVNNQITNLTAFMIDTSPDIDKTMESVYKMDYEKRGLPVTQYRSLMAAVDSPIGLPIIPAVIDLKHVYRDPIRFRHSAMEDSMIQPTRTKDLQKAAETCSLWDEPFAGCSEYTDTISKMGLINMKNLQRYLMPLQPSRRFDKCNLPKMM